MGVVSFGVLECGAAGSPTVFTKLGYYVPWIESVVVRKSFYNTEIAVVSITESYHKTKPVIFPVVVASEKVLGAPGHKGTEAYGSGFSQ